MGYRRAAGRSVHSRHLAPDRVSRSTCCSATFGRTLLPLRHDRVSHECVERRRDRGRGGARAYARRARARRAAPRSRCSQRSGSRSRKTSGRTRVRAEAQDLARCVRGASRSTRSLRWMRGGGERLVCGGVCALRARHRRASQRALDRCRRSSSAAIVAERGRRCGSIAGSLALSWSRSWLSISTCRCVRHTSSRTARSRPHVLPGAGGGIFWNYNDPQHAARACARADRKRIETRRASFSRRSIRCTVKTRCGRSSKGIARAVRRVRVLLLAA